MSHLRNFSKEDVLKLLRDRGVPCDVSGIVFEAEVNGQVLLEFEKEDVQDLMPGPSMFLTRRKLWKVISDLKEATKDKESCAGQKRKSTTELSVLAPKAPTLADSHHLPSESKSPPLQRSDHLSCGTPVVLSSAVSFPLYSDTSLASLGSGQKIVTNLRNRLVRNQISIMRAECSSLVPPREPNSAELKQVALKLVERYPALQDDQILNPSEPFGSLLMQLKRRLSNVKPTKKPQGRVPGRCKSQQLVNDKDVLSTELEDQESSDDDSLYSEAPCNKASSDEASGSIKGAPSDGTLRASTKIVPRHGSSDTGGSTTTAPRDGASGSGGSTTRAPHDGASGSGESTTRAPHDGASGSRGSTRRTPSDGATHDRVNSEADGRSSKDSVLDKLQQIPDKETLQSAAGTVQDENTKHCCTAAVTEASAARS